MDLYGEKHELGGQEVLLEIVAVHPLTRTGEYTDKGKEIVSSALDAMAARYASYLYSGGMIGPAVLREALYKSLMETATPQLEVCHLPRLHQVYRHWQG